MSTAGIIVIVCTLILLFILFRPHRSEYTQDITSTRNSRERGFGEW